MTRDSSEHGDDPPVDPDAVPRTQETAAETTDAARAELRKKLAAWIKTGGLQQLAE
ncbi:hypothetical protein ABZ319_30105 [Nocardia sp. NPDC005978]|uniref:hypothetical protein n=1 Tax=Nocardia sp. NPDC005978 TaxID=3156725 RepID=UPI0033A05886